MATTSRQQLRVGKGRSKAWSVLVEDSTGAVDLSSGGRTLRFRARYHDTDPDPAVLLKTTGSGITHAPDQVAAKGKATLALVPADTQALTADRLYYELDLLEGGDVYELAKGTLWLEQTN